MLSRMKTQPNFRVYNSDQLLLLPPDLAQWLPEDHLVYFIRDVAGQMDLSDIYATYDGSKGGLSRLPSRDDGGSVAICLLCGDAQFPSN